MPRPQVLLPILFLFLCSAAAIAAGPTSRPDYRQAIEALRQARQSSTLDAGLGRMLAANCLAYGLDLLREEKLAEAFSVLSEGYAAAPEDPRFSFHLGYILLGQGSLGEAESLLRQSARLGGPLPEIYRLLARACYGQGRLSEAQSYLEQVLALEPEEGSRTFLDKIGRELAIEETMGSRYGGTFEISYVAGGEQLGNETLDVLRDAYAELGTLFNAFPEQPVAVILYGNQDFTAVTGAPDWAGGAYDGKIRVPVGGLQRMNDELRRILYHEFAHVLIFTVARGNVPRWLEEGLAQVAEGAWGDTHRAHLAQIGKDADLIPLARIERSFANLSAPEAAAAYLQTHAFARYLLDRYGWPRMLDLLQALGSGKGFSEALRLLLYAGENFTGIREGWQREEGLVFSRSLQ